MRRIVLFISSVLIAFAGFGQNCVSDQNITEVGFHPKTIEPAYVDSVYKQVLQVRIFKDTSVVLNGNPVLATIDSIVVTGIAGLPTGFYYTCANKNCTFVPDSTGCATLEGTANKSDVGEHNLDIQITIYAKIFGTVSTTQKDTIRQFTMMVEDLNSAKDVSKQHMTLYPNPSNNRIVNVSGKLLDDIQSVTCINALGQPVEYTLNNGRIELLNGASGIYTITILTASGQNITQRVVFTNN